MYNWNTDTSKFRNKEDKRIWELTQLLDYGFGEEKVSRRELMTLWPKLRDRIDPEVRRLYELTLWDKVYSLPTSNTFWQASPPTKRL